MEDEAVLVEKVAFWTTGENMTRIMRDFWEEGNCIHAMKTAKEGMGMSEELGIKLLTGEMMLVGDTREGDHTLNLQDDTTGYEGKSVDRMFNFFKKKYVDLNIGKMEYDLNLRNNIIRGINDNDISEIRDTERHVRGQAIQMEKDKFEYIKQLTFLCKISNHTLEEIGDAVFSEMNEREYNKEVEMSNKHVATIKQIEDEIKRSDTRKWVKDRIETENKPLEIGKAGDSAHGWISPTGKFYICGYMEHIMIAEKLAEDKVVHTDGSEKELENLGWMKLTKNEFLMFADKLFIPQRNFIIDHMIEMEMKTIEINGGTFKNIDEIDEYLNYKYGML